jgi:alkylhydroperoxidase/carboxymuconolactone decarboxylase family protein YurZ
MAADGFELARSFDAAAVAVKDRLFADWDRLTPKQRQELDDAFWDMTTVAMTLRTKAVGGLLARASLSVAALSAQTERAKKALATLEDIRKAIKVATAALGLVTTVSAAVASGNVSALGPVFQSVKALLDELGA